MYIGGDPVRYSKSLLRDVVTMEPDPVGSRMRVVGGSGRVVRVVGRSLWVGRWFWEQERGVGDMGQIARGREGASRWG